MAIGASPSQVLKRLSGHATLYEAVVGAMRGTGELSILDVGSGPGPLARLFLDQYGAEKIGKYVGIDFSDQAGTGFRAAFTHFANFRFVRAEITDPELGRINGMHGPFDLIVCCEVLEHLEDDIEICQAIRRIASDGGRIIVSVPARPGIKTHLRHYDNESFGDRVVRHLRPFSKFDTQWIGGRWIIGIADV